MGIRAEIQDLVDRLTDDELPAARAALKAVVDDSTTAHPLEAVSDVERSRLRKSLQVGEGQIKRGEGLSADEARRRLRS